MLVPTRCNEANGFRENGLAREVIEAKGLAPLARLEFALMLSLVEVAIFVFVDNLSRRNSNIDRRLACEFGI
jgi:hypothetical protein